MFEIQNTDIPKYLIIFVISVIQLGTIAYLKKVMFSAKESPETLMGLNDKFDNKIGDVYQRIDDEKDWRMRGDEKLRDMIDDTKVKLNRNCNAITEINTRCKERDCNAKRN